MKKSKVSNSFNNNKFKYGGYAAAMSIIFLAILVFVNLVVGKFDIKFDLTQNKMFSLSDQTYKVMENLDKEINIYGFYESGKEDKMISNILEKYEKGSDKINLEYKDPIKYPQFANKYTGDGDKVGIGSVIVESEDKFKVLDPYDFVNYSYTDYYNAQPESLAVEQNVTSAIMNVTSDNNNVIYTLSGHGEDDIGAELRKQFERENYEVKSINILNEAESLDENSILLISAPKRDLSEEEDKNIREFLNKGGKAVFLMELVNDELTKFNELFKTYGIALNRAPIVEGNSQFIIQQPIYLLPIIKNHDITNTIISNKLNVFIPGAQGIDVLDLKKKSLKIDPLLTSTNKSWAKTDLNITTLEKEEGDLEGPFNVAVAVTDTDNNSQIIVVSNSSFASTQASAISNGANTDFVLNSFNWLQGEEERISIRPKKLEENFLYMNGQQQLIFSGIVVILIPLLVMIIGIRVWIRRKNR